MLTKDNRLNIIHLSDAHIAAHHDVDLNRVKQALISDINQVLSKEERQKTIVCFTGDLIKSGEYGFAVENQYNLAIDNLIFPLSDETGISLENFIFVPGNHEIDKTKIEPIYNDGLRSKLKDYDGNTLIDYTQQSSLRERLQGFREFERTLFGKIYSEDIVDVRKMEINGNKVGVCMINTSWCLSSESTKEKGSVIIGKNNLYKALQRLQSCKYKICLMHHSVAWLHEADLVGIESLLAKFDLVLFGHSHFASEQQLVSPNGKSIFCMASNLLPLNTGTGYNVIKIYAQECTVMQRQFYNTRDCFDKNLSIENGETTFQLNEVDDKALIFNACVKTKKKFRDKLNVISLNSLLSESTRTFENSYIVPTLTLDPNDVLVESDKTTEKIIKPDEMINSTDNFVIYGRKDYGKTMLLHYIALQYYQNCSNSFLPILIDCQRLKDKENEIYEYIRDYLNNLGEEDFKISVLEVKRMLNTGKCILLFDNFSHNLDTYTNIAKFVKDYKINKRFFAILQTPSAILENKTFEELGDAQSYKKVYMNYLTKNEIRRFAHNLSNCSESELTMFTNKIVSCFSKTYLPRNPFAVALVISVCNINADYEPVNLAAVVKRFLEIVMDRLSPKELLSNEFNFDIKEDFLAYIAYQMVQNNLFEISIATYDKWTDQYHKDNGFNKRESHFDEYFFACGILTNENGRVAFKYRCLLEYYIAKRATIDSSFLNEILSESKFVHFMQELVYCAGIDVRNKTVVETLGKYLDDAISGDKIDTSFISGDKISLELSLTDEQMKVEILDKQMNEDEVDVATDEKDNSDQYLPATISKTDDYGSAKYELEQFDDLLFCFGNVLRNSELTGLDSRSKAFEKYMRGTLYWCSIFAQNVEEIICLVRRDILDSKEEISAETKSKIENMFRDFCRVLIPCIAESNMYENLGTKKMESILNHYYSTQDDYCALDKFFVLLLCCDLKISGWKNQLADFIENSKNKDLLFILFVKLTAYYRHCHFGKVNNKIIADMLFSLRKKLDKNAGALHGQVKNQFMNDLAKLPQLPSK